MQKSKRQAAPLAQIAREPATKKPAPFVKWAGGKSQLLSTFEPFLPESFGSYFEPFVGGGALFFHLYGQGLISQAVLSDLNQELVNCYQVIRTDVKKLIGALRKHRNDSDYFYAVRAQDPKQLANVERAARIIYLNKTCFNGLYRVNSRGQFNVPFGSYKNPRTCDEENLTAVHFALANVDIVCNPFDKTLSRARTGDFVYLDPPYQPLSSTANFTGYTSQCFAAKDQERLAKVFAQLTARGCHVMLSNSDNEFVRALYSDFRLETVYANRAINCRAERRGKISEVLVLNY